MSSRKWWKKKPKANEPEEYQEPKASLESEALEPRIMMSATWVDADMDAEIDAPTDGDEVFMGSVEADTADGLGGDDLLYGGDGSDDLMGGAGRDVLLGAAGDDTLSGGTGDDLMVGGAGADTLVSGGGHDNMVGGEGDDTFAFDGVEDGDVIQVDGGEGTDTLDLQSYGSGSVTNDGSSLTVEMEDGQSFRIEYTDIENILTGDGVSLASEGIEDSDPTAVDDSTPGTAAQWAPDSEGNPEQVVDAGESVTLSAFEDRDAGNLTYSWSQVQGPLVELTDADSSNPGFTAPNDAGTVIFAVTATDVDGTEYVDLIEVEVNGSDLALAGLDQTVTEGDTVTLSGEGADGLKTTWVQTGGPDVVLSDVHATEPTFEAPEVDSDQEITFELVVSEVENALLLDGTSDYVDTNADFSWGYESSFSISATVTPDTVSGLDAIVGKGEGIGSRAEWEYTLMRSGDDAHFIYWNTGGSHAIDIRANDVFTAGESTSVSVTYDSDSHMARLYVDGVEVGQDESNGRHQDRGSSLKVGMGYTWGNTVFDGSVHDVQVHNVALDASEVSAVGNGGVVAEGLALHYNFQEVAAGTVEDQSGNGRDGSLVGDPETVESESTEVARDTVVVTIEALNEGPQASAGPDQSVTEGDTVQLVGSGTEPEGQPISFTWVQTAGTPVTLDDPSAASPQFEAPEGLVNSDITFELQVSDGVNTTADHITVTVNADNDAPSSSAGEDQTVQEGDAVTLSGSGTDPEGQGLTYTWVQTSGPDVILSDSNAPIPTFDSPGVASDSDLVFELQVSDGENVSVDTVTIHLVADVFVPSAEAGSDFAVNEGEMVQLVADTSGNNPSLDLSDHTLSRYGGEQDAHGDYEVINGGEGVRIGGNSWASMDLAYTVTADTILEFDYRNTGNAEISGIGFDTDSSINSNRTFKVSGTQNWGIQSGFDTYSADDGEWQKIQIRVGDFYTGDFDSLFFVNDHDAGNSNSEGFFANINLYEAGDAVAQDVTYTWVQTSGTPVVLDDIHSPTPSFDAPEGLVNSDVTFELQVSDGTTVSTDSITVTIQADNDAPSASAGSDQTVDEGDVVVLSGSGSDPEGQGLTYQWVQTSGTSVVLDDATAAAPSFSAPEGLVNSDITFELRISDGTNESTDSVTVTVNADNDAPSTNAGPDQMVDEGDVVVLSGSANDPEGQTLTYSWVQTGGPAVILDDVGSASPTFSAPEGLDATEVTFELTVSDGTHQSVDTVAVTIQADNDGPSADAGSDQSVNEGDVVTLRGSGVDPEGQDLTYRWVQTGGPDIVLDDPTSAAPTFVAPEGLANVDFTFELQVSDGESMQADLVTVTVNADNDAPSAVASVPKPGMWNYEYFDLPGSSYSNLDQAGFTLEGGSQSSLTPTETGVTDSLNPSGFDTGDLFGLRMTTQLVIDEAGSYDFQSYADDGVRLFVDGVEVLEDDGLHAARNASGDPVDLTAGVHELTVVYFENRGGQVLDVSISGPDTGDAFVSLGGYSGVNAGSQTVVDEGQLVQLDGSASSDPESEGLTYRWVQTGGSTVVLSDANSATPSFVAPEGLINSNVTFELQVSDGTNVSTDTVTLLVNADNDAPTAEAGSHQAVQELDTVQLVGSGVDPEGEGLSYQWVQTSGTPVVLDDATSSSPTFRAPEGLVNSDLNFELRVSDGVHTSVDTVVITVGADNDAPSSDAGPDQIAEENATVQLAGSGLDPEAQGVTFEWVQVSGPSVVLDDFTAPDPIFSAPEWVANTEVVFELRVSDGVHTTSDTVSVTINADNDAPSAEAGPDQSVAEGATVQLAGSGVDPEGEGLTYNWVQVSGPAVVLDQADIATPTFDAPNWLSNSDVAFELHVSDGTNTSVDTVTITIQADDDAPSCRAGFDQTVVENSTVQLGGFAEDPEGQGLTYTWVQTSGPSVVLSDAHSLDPTFSSPDLVANSDITFEFRVSDGVNTSVDSVTIAVNADDDAPSADAGPNQAVEENSEVQLRGVGVDPEGTGLTYTWLQTSGPTVILSGADTASPTFTAPELLSNTDVVFELSVSDGVNVSVDTVTVTVGADNDSPAIDAGADLQVQEDDLVQLSGQATDPEGQGLTYEWTQTAGPSVELMNADSATPTFVAPNLAADADVVFELRVSDGVNTAVDTMVVQIVADDDSPVNVDAGSDQTVEELDQVQLVGVGTDLEGQDLTYRWVQTSGTPVVLDDAYSDSPQFRAPEGLVNSDLTFELQVSDGLHTTTDTVTVTVQADDDAPSADAGVDQTVNELDAVHLAGTGVDPEGEGLTYQWIQTGGPTVTLDDPSSENPRFVSPDGLANTDFTFELRVSDGVNVSSDTVTITVNADNDAPIADAGADLMVPEGEWVQLESTSSDPEGQPLTHQWVQIAGPPVQLDDNTAPDPKFEAPNLLVNGDVVFELRVSDGVHTSMDLVTVTVVSDNDAPVDVSAGTDQVVDELDVVRLIGTGADLEGQGLTYRWVQTGGTPIVLSDAGSSSPVFQAPEGLVNSDLTFELRVSDGVNVTTDAVTITVHADDDAPSALAGENQSVDENAVVQLVGQGVDPEGQGLTYEWVQVGGPSVLLADPDAAQTQFTAPDLLANTDIVLQLRISDGVHTSTDTVTVTVHADDDAPIADAGADLSVLEDSLVQLQGHGVDPEGQGLTYTWVQTSGPAMVLDDAHAQNPTFTTPNLLANSEVEFELHVSDGVQTSVDTVVVTIQADDDAPIADAGRNQVVEELDRVQLIGGGVDPEGQGLTYEWVQTSGTPVVLDDTQAESPTFQAPDGLVNSDLRFELRVSDGVNTSVDSVTVTVHADNDAPSANAGPDQRVEELDRVTLDGVGVDPEAQGLTFEWVQVSGPTVVLDDPGLAAPSFQAPELVEDSQIVFELRVGDGVHVSTDTVTIQIDADDDAPVEVSAGPDRTVDELDLIQLTGGGHELEGQDLTYEWVQTSGVLVQLNDPTGPSPTFEAPEGLVNSELAFRLSVSDGTHVVTDDVTITVRADNDVPTADAGESFGVEEGSFAYLSGVGLDPEGQGVTYEWVQVSGPQVTLDNPHAAEASFLTPNQVKNTDIVFELHVSDGVNVSVDEVTVTIEADDDAPTADAGTGGTFDAGDNVRLMGSGTDPEGTGLTYSWVQKEGPPVSLFNAGSQTPSFTAPTGIGGTLVFEVSVSDGVNTSVDTVRIVINESAEELDPEVAEADPVQAGFSVEALEDPFHQLNEALDHVEADVADGPLQEVVGQVITLADAPLGAESEQALLDLLAPLAGIEDFSKVFQTPTGIDDSQDGEETFTHDSATEDVLQRVVSEDLARDGIEKPEASNDGQAEAGIAKFFGLVRGLAGTTDKTENQNHDRKSKDAKRRD